MTAPNKRELLAEEQRQIAEREFGKLNWVSETEAFMECPGKSKHTNENNPHDCRVTVGDGRAPTVYCFHTSCSAEIATANYRLRSALGKAETSGCSLPGFNSRGKAAPITPLPPVVKAKTPLDPAQLPKPLPNAMRTFVENGFKSGEYVSWQATGENGKTPALRSYTMERDKLAEQPEQELNPNGYGLYVRVNPMKASGSTADEVAEYRQVLLECDDAPLELQWAAAVASGLPIVTVVHSGGKSLHLIVRVDAGQDRELYKQRAKMAKACLEQYEGIIVDNVQDPARLTRFGGARRGDKRQDLLAVNIGARSWEEWEAKHKANAETKASVLSQEQQEDKPEPSNGRSTIYYLRQGSKFLWEQPSGQKVFANEETVKRVYLNEINPGALTREQGRYIYRIQTAQALDYAGSMPGYREGLHSENGQLFYCMESPVMPKVIPSKTAQFGERWPVIYELMRRLFVGEDGETQFWTVFAHLKMSHEVLKQSLEPKNAGSRRSVRPGQAMALIGPKNSGKSLFLSHVITPLLGGRLVDAYKAFMADPEGFNGELLKGEVWMIDDQESSTDIRTRRKFAAHLKSKLFGASMAFHAKYNTPVTLKPFGRLFVCCNSTPENLSVLPPITDDISDKIHLILCNKAEMPMPTGTESQREAFREAIAQEIPHLAGELEAWLIPAEIAHQRTGVLTYLNPWIEDQLRKQSPEAQLVELILSAFETGTLHGRVWEGPARKLKDHLTAEKNRAHRDARSLLSAWIAATGTYLARLVAASPVWEGTSGLKIEALGQRKGIERYRLSLV